MVLRVTVYGWIVNLDPVRGPGSGVLVDLVYFIDDNIRVEDVLGIINQAGYKILSKKIAGTKIREQDRVTIDNWDEHLKVGTEHMENINFEQSNENEMTPGWQAPYVEPSQQYGYYL